MQKEKEQMQDTHQQWFKDAKFGLFIHFGLYSVLAGEYRGRRTNRTAEWIMNDLDIPREEYRRLAAQFDPADFDADRIVRRAKECGMRYLVFTAMHHEGFAMYHSHASPYNVVDFSPCRRDILKELQLACEKYGMKLGLYYSQAQDWDDPDGYVYGKDNSHKDFQAHLERKCLPQIRELLTEYGDIALLWFDTPMGITKEQSRALFDLVKSLQPDCIVSGRIGNDLGEYMTTGDNFIPRLPYPGDWEVPATLNDTWGYSRFDHNWKHRDDILRLLLQINSRGGNYLLNVGPDASGRVPEESVEILNAVGAYVRENGDAIFQTKRVDGYAYELEWAEITRKDYRLYLHVLEPKKRLELINIGNHVRRAYVLRDGRELPVATNATCEGAARIEAELPEDLQTQKNYCICLELEERDPIFEPLL